MPAPTKTLLTLFLYLSCPLFLSGQTTDNPVMNCATDELTFTRQLANPKQLLLEERLEREWSDYVHSPLRTNPPPYTLPIVFHLIHDNGPENLTDAEVEQGLSLTNKAFANAGYYDQGTGVSTNIQFCLARRTPANQGSSGIDRVVSAQYTDLEANSEDEAMKDLARWDPRDYINVYVVKEICREDNCGVAGYAYLPSAHGSSVDGVVIEARWLAGGEAAAVVLAHELGHYLGLRHTFQGGCTNDDCTQDGDRVCDTPPDQSQVAVPCTGAVNTCSTDTDSGFATDENDMITNYMDYGYFACQSAFTQGQTDRMYFFIEGIRASLLESKGCENPCPTPVTASFTGGDVTVEAGTTIAFTNTSVNGNGYTWQVNGITEATADDFSRLFDQEGFFTVRLLAGGAPPLCAGDELSRTVRVVCSTEAQFTPSGPVAVGESRTFTNQSAAADSYTWQLDGTPISVAEDLTYTFTAPGLYTLCLTARRGACEDEFCRLVFVGEESTAEENCTGSFVYTYQTQVDGNLLYFGITSVIPDGEGGYYYAGADGRNSLVVRVDADGNILWQTDLYPPTTITIADDLLLDHDGFLAGFGETSVGGYLFRIDPATGELLYGRYTGFQFGRVNWSDISQSGPGQPYRLSGTADRPNQRNRVAVVDFDPITGLPTGTDAYVSDDFGITALGHVEHTATGNTFVLGERGQLSNVLMEFDAGGSLLNSLEFGQDLFLGSNIGDIQQDGDTLVMAMGTPGSNTAIIPWTIYKYLPGTGFTAAYSFLNTSNASNINLSINDAGYLITGTLDNEGFLAQVTRSGNLAWMRRYDAATPFVFFSRTEVLPDQSILVALNQSASAGIGALSFARLLPDGTFANNCITTEELSATRGTVSLESVAAAYTDLDLGLFTQEFGWEPAFLSFSSATCVEPCEETPPEICGNLIDDDLDGLVDCEDPDLAADCCCLDGPGRLLGNQEESCGNGISVNIPAEGERRLLYTDENGVTTDTLDDFSRSITAVGIHYLTYIDRCNRTASDTLTLHPRSRPQLELGPDTTLCSNAVIPLLAQPGFATYEWFDGSTERAFTAFEAGNYWVVATDSCGEAQTDTVRVRIDPATEIDLGRDTLICPGDTLSFSLSGFTDYQWSQSSYLDCFDCPTVRFTPDRDTLLLVVAQAGPGCFSSDSIRVRITSQAGSSTVSELCNGDTLMLGGQLITTGGSYLDTIPVGNCFRVDTVLVSLLSDTLTRDSLTLCSGSETVLFGQTVTEAGTYVGELQRTNGCDSTVIVEVIIRGNLSGSESIAICRGDTATIFGQPVTEAGSYQREFTGSGGCDSVYQVTLTVSGASISTRVIADDCGGAAAGAGEVIVSEATPPFSIRWSTGDTTTQLTNLAAGTYVVTVTDASGCPVTDRLVIAETPLPEVGLQTTPETCPNENDGSLTLSGAPGLLYSLNGSAFTGSTVYPNLAPGDYSLVVLDENDCEQDLSFSITAATGGFVSLEDAYRINFGDSLIIVANTNLDPGALVWTQYDSVICNGCPSVTLRPEASLQLTASISATTDCPSTAETSVVVTRENLLYVPNAFSPNGDGVNDIFQIFPSAGVTEILRFAVYDRWGGEVFLRESPDPTDVLNGWDGLRPNGRHPTLGVYVYLVEVRLFNGDTIKVAGDVTLMR